MRWMDQGFYSDQGGYPLLLGPLLQGVNVFRAYSFGHEQSFQDVNHRNKGSPKIDII